MHVAQTAMLRKEKRNDRRDIHSLAARVKKGARTSKYVSAGFSVMVVLQADFLMSEPPEKPSIHDMFIKLRNAIPWGGSKCLYDTSSYWTPTSLFPPRLLGILEKVFNWELRPRVQALGVKVHSSRSPLACSAFTIALYNEGQCTRRLFWLSNIPWIYVTRISLWMFFWHAQRGICLVQAPFSQVCCLLSLPVPIGHM